MTASPFLTLSSGGTLRPTPTNYFLHPTFWHALGASSVLDALPGSRVALARFDPVRNDGPIVPPWGGSHELKSCYPDLLPTAFAFPLLLYFSFAAGSRPIFAQSISAACLSADSLSAAESRADFSLAVSSGSGTISVW